MEHFNGAITVPIADSGPILINTRSWDVTQTLDCAPISWFAFILLLIIPT